MDGDRRILIVDDNPAIHDDFRKILAPRAQAEAELDALEAAAFGTPLAAVCYPHHELRSCMQGEHGVADVKAAREAGAPFAVAFVDVRMPPGIDGVEAAARMLEADADLQVVLCSAYSDHGWLDIAARLGRHADRVLVLRKPFDPLEVQQLATALCGRWKLAEHERQRLDTLAKAVRHQSAAVEQLTRDLDRQRHDRAEVEAQLRLAQRLEGAGKLVTGVAHEINTPLQYVTDNVAFVQKSVVDLLELLEAFRAAAEGDEAGRLDKLRAAQARAEAVELGFLTAELPQALAEASEGTERVARIVAAMRELTQRPADKAPVDLHSTLENAVAMARGEHRPVADVHLELEAIPAVVCHADEIGQVVVNLVINAAHAIADAVGDSGARGTIWVRTRADGDGVVIEVEDTGTGIPDEIHARVFEPFFTTKAADRGSGQGLGICRNIVVDRHGGTLTFVSVPGRGTLFRVWLPLEDPAAAA